MGVDGPDHYLVVLLEPLSIGEKGIAARARDPAPDAV